MQTNIGNLLDLFILLNLEHIEIENEDVEDDSSQEKSPVKATTLLNVDDRWVLLAASHQVHNEEKAEQASTHEMAPPVFSIRFLLSNDGVSSLNHLRSGTLLEFHWLLDILCFDCWRFSGKSRGVDGFLNS